MTARTDSSPARGYVVTDATVAIVRPSSVSSSPDWSESRRAGAMFVSTTTGAVPVRSVARLSLAVSSRAWNARSSSRKLMASPIGIAAPSTVGSVPLYRTRATTLVPLLVGPT